MTSREQEIQRRTDLSVTRITKAVFPSTTNHHNTLFGGTKLMIHQYGVTPMLIGIAAAAISAALAVKWLVSYLQSHGLSVFGWYRIALGAVVGGLIVAGVFRA